MNNSHQALSDATNESITGQYSIKHDPIIRKKELIQMLGVHPSTIYRWIKSVNFPRPIKLGVNSVGWRLSEINAWVESRNRVKVMGVNNGK